MTTIELQHHQSQQANAALPPAPAGLRERALRDFGNAGFPTPRLEDWKYTNLHEIAAGHLPLAGEPSIDNDVRAALAEHTSNATAIVFVNGRATDIGAIGELPPGVVLASLADTLAGDPSVVETAIAGVADIERSSLVALNTAFLGAGAMLRVADDTIVEQPIHLLYASQGSKQAAANHIRNLISLGRNSQATVVEHYLGLDDGAYWTNSATDITLANGSRLTHYKIQRESNDAFHTADIAAVQGADSSLHSLSVSLGARLCRNDIRSCFTAAGGHCSLDGLYMADGAQHVDHHTLVDHAAPHCTSVELYKGILGGNATGVFNGKVLVRHEGQRTDAQQLNKNLLLSDAATINTKPQLEIFADDVKCSHGATIGQLDEDAVFFLRTRGLDEPAARSLLTDAFANEIVEKIAIDSVRERLQAMVRSRLGAIVASKASQ